jgi:hypothetical protein
VRKIGAWLSDEAAAGWQQFAAANGVTVTALLEAFGVAFPLPDLPERAVTEIVGIARQVDLERRARRAP